MLDLLGEMLKVQQAQAQMYSALFKTWTEPPPEPKDYVHAEDREILDDLRAAADEGDEDAKAILASDKLRNSYLSNFR